ncbi:MAG: translation initiation factor IF-3 [Eubacteriales bacterium]|nr:translation initiation factor IF-3 [Eubacteriales bacterium]
MEENKIKKETWINDEIRAKELRVIDEDGSMAGIMSLDDALALAEKRGLDLVEISPNAKPPVAKVLDYGKYRYEIQKREKDARKKQHNMQVKEIRLSTFIEGHDLQVKANVAEKFLRGGDKVKVSLRFRGREMAYKDKGREVMNQFADLCSEFGQMEKKVSLEGRSLSMFLVPKQDKPRPKNKKKPAETEQNADNGNN